MRVVVTCVPQSGHLLPLLPLARAFAELGDEVVVATSRDVSAAVDDAGLDVVPVGHGLDAWFRTLAERVPGVPGDGLAPERIERYFVPRLFAEIGAADVIDGLLRLGHDWRPDLVVFDQMAFAGPLAATVLGVRMVHHGIGPALDPEILDLAADALSPLWRRYGRDVPPFGGVYSGLTLTICPLEFDPDPAPPGAATASMRTSTSSVPDRGALPPGLAVSGGRPLVYATLGTFSNRDVEVFRAILDGLAGDSLDVVVTVGPDNDPDALRPVPPNVRVERFVPQSVLLPYCAAVIHHGGSGTLLGTLAHGLPALVLPQGADNFTNAARIAKARLGRVLLPPQMSAAAVRSELREVLRDPVYRANAQRAAGQMAAMPSPLEVARSIRRHAG